MCNLVKNEVVKRDNRLCVHGISDPCKNFNVSHRCNVPMSVNPQSCISKNKKKIKRAGEGGYENAYRGDVQHGVRGSDRHGQARQTSVEKISFGHPEQTISSCEFENSKKLYFWVFPHGTRDQFLS